MTIDQFINELDEKPKKLETELGKAIAKSCLLVQRTCQESMTNTKVNEAVTYYTHNKTIGHHPSLPYNPPAVDTGNLRRSITFEVDEKKMEGIVGTTVYYGAYLELAEYGSSRMQPRPWLKPSLDKNYEEIKKILAEASGRLK